MRLHFTLSLLAICLFFFTQAQPSVVSLNEEENYSPTYDEIIAYYQQLDAASDQAKLIPIGTTDSGKPLHAFIISTDGDFSPQTARENGKTVLLINNGIHPGEPAGINASILYANKLLSDRKLLEKTLDQTILIFIPVYNIGGCLNRSAFNRANQSSPLETGFRGNARNLDLNRDFIKADSHNTRSLSAFLQRWQPDVLLDTHTTNGSNHSYSNTLMPPQPDQFPQPIAQFLRQDFIPALYREMAKGDYELIPYVYWIYKDPRQGIAMTQLSARYTTGFASLFNCYGFITENHVYKYFPDRVKSCLQFIETLTEFVAENGESIRSSREKANQETLEMTEYPIQFELDTTQYQQISFKGFATSDSIVDRVTGLKRFGYDQNQPYNEKIKYFDHYTVTETVEIPEIYIIPQAWTEAIERLQLNGVEMTRLKQDSTMLVQVDYISDYQTVSTPTNGHYFHTQVSTESQLQSLQFYAGDYLVPTRQARLKYVVECLEPKAQDSFFRWNFFDEVLEAREYFSNYGFEENALKYLNEHPDFKKKLEEKRQSDPDFASDHHAQLQYIYDNSEWKEKSYKRYPVAKLFN